MSDPVTVPRPDPDYRPPLIADGTVAQGLIDGLVHLIDEYGEAGVRSVLDDPGLRPWEPDPEAVEALLKALRPAGLHAEPVLRHLHAEGWHLTRSEPEGPHHDCIRTALACGTVDPRERTLELRAEVQRLRDGIREVVDARNLEQRVVMLDRLTALIDQDGEG